MDSPASSQFSQQTVPELPEQVVQRDLRSDFVEAYGARVFLILSALGSLFLLPFSIHNLVQAQWLLGATTLLIVVFLVVNAAALTRGREPPFPPLAVFAPALLGLGAAVHQQGLIGIFWCYPAILLFHFVLPRRTANLFNGSIVLVAIPLAWLHLGPAITARVGGTLALTMLFTNIFSYVADAQRRKEMEQRHRLDLVLRGTHAGTLELFANGRAEFSARLKEMLGRGYEADARSWDFFDFLHPDDRGRVQAQVRAAFGQAAPARSVRHQPADEFRLLRPDGEVVWVHAEGIAVADRRGRTTRYIFSMMDVTERVRSQEALIRSHERVEQQARELERRNAELRDAMRMREEVERIARHDLKTPLSSIVSVARLLRHGRPLEPRESELLDIVERGVRRVLAMVNLSLDLYRMEEGSYAARREPVDLGALVRSVAAELRGECESRRVRIAVSAPAQPLQALGDEMLCYAIVSNLLKNAVEAAPAGSTVDAVLEPASRHGEPGRVLRIHNLGAVPQPIRARFFEKYATHGKPQGTGLGAYSAWLMARVQHGELQMDTDDEAGTTLALWLPADGSAEPTLPLAAGPARGGEAVPPLSILLVDDDPCSVVLLRSLLPVPLPVEVVGNGRLALEHVARRRPDLVFLDLHMLLPGTFELVAQLRAVQAAQDQMPSVVVALATAADDITRQRCRQAGFDAVLAKPPTREELLSVLRLQPAFAASAAAGP